MIVRYRLEQINEKVGQETRECEFEGTYEELMQLGTDLKEATGIMENMQNLFEGMLTK